MEEDYKYKCVCGKKYKHQQSLWDHGNKSSRHVNEGRGCPEYKQRRAEGKLVNVYGLDDKIIINNNTTINDHSITNNENNSTNNNNEDVNNNIGDVKINYKKQYNTQKDLNEMIIKGSERKDKEINELNIEVDKLNEKIKMLNKDNDRLKRINEMNERRLSKYGETKPAFNI